MTAITWPTQLPYPLIDPYRIKPGEAINRSPMTSGPARQRREFEQVPSQISVTWWFTQWQFGIFEGWYKWYAKEGAAYFKVVLLGGLGEVEHDARFFSQWDHNQISGDCYEVSAVLEIRERPTLDKGAIDIALTQDIPALLAAIDQLHIHVHQTMPSEI